MSLSTLKPKGKNTPTLKQKVGIIKTADSNPKIGVRKLAEIQ